MGSVRFTKDSEEALRSLADRSTTEFIRLMVERETQFDDHKIEMVTIGPELNWALQFVNAGGWVTSSSHESKLRKWCGIPVVVDPILGDEFAAWRKVT